MKKITYVFMAIYLTACASATRLSIPPEEAHYRYKVSHQQDQAQAFSEVEVVLAQTYNDLPKVLKLKQPESGTFILKPLVHYKAGGSMGADQYAPYNLKIVVKQQTIDLTFDLGQEQTYGTWAPPSEIPKIRASFRSVASEIATAVGGSVE